MNYERLLQEVEKFIEPILADLGLELVEREFLQSHGGWVLRIYIDSEKGPVTLDDCERTSRAIEGVLDVEDIIPYRYRLEVSSPGVERPLRKERDFERFKGSEVELKTKGPLENKSHFRGHLLGMREGEIVIDEGGREYLIPLHLLKKAKVKRR